MRHSRCVPHSFLDSSSANTRPPACTDTAFRRIGMPWAHTYVDLHSFSRIRAAVVRLGFLRKHARSRRRRKVLPEKPLQPAITACVSSFQHFLIHQQRRKQTLFTPDFHHQGDFRLRVRRGMVMRSMRPLGQTLPAPVPSCLPVVRRLDRYPVISADPGDCVVSWW